MLHNTFKIFLLFKIRRRRARDHLTRFLRETAEIPPRYSQPFDLDVTQANRETVVVCTENTLLDVPRERCSMIRNVYDKIVSREKEPRTRSYTV